MNSGLNFRKSNLESSKIKREMNDFVKNADDGDFQALTRILEIVSNDIKNGNIIALIYLEELIKKNKLQVQLKHLEPLLKISLKSRNVDAFNIMEKLLKLRK